MDEKRIDEWLLSIPNPITRRKYVGYVREFLRVSTKTVDTITVGDLESYLASKPTWTSKHLAQAAVRNFLEHVGRPVATRYIGVRPARRPIQEPTPAELERLWHVVEHDLDPLERAILYLLRDTGHRRKAVAFLKRSDLKMTPGGPVVEFSAETDKRGVPSVAPVTDQTYQACQDLADPRDGFLLPIAWKGLEGREEFITRAVDKAARRAGIFTRIHAHLFRHMLALRCRRANVQEDVAVNLLGWKDGQMYNSLYGRRQPYETVDRAREIVDPNAPKRRQTRAEEYLTK